MRYTDKISLFDIVYAEQIDLNVIKIFPQKRLHFSYPMKYIYLLSALLFLSACSKDDGGTGSEVENKEAEREKIPSAYSFDENGRLVILTTKERRSAKDFAEKVCGSCWRIIRYNKIDADGTVESRQYESDLVGFGFSRYYFEADSTIEYIHDDSLPGTFPFSHPTIYDEDTGLMLDENGIPIISIVSINDDNTLTLILWDNPYPDPLQLTYQRMTEKEYKALLERVRLSEEMLKTSMEQWRKDLTPYR